MAFINPNDGIAQPATAKTKAGAGIQRRGTRPFTFKTIFGEVTVKLGLKDTQVVQVAPEFESCRAISETSGVPLRTIYEAAIAEWRSKNP